MKVNFLTKVLKKQGVIMKPQEIESLSFRIVEEEAKDHGFDKDHWPIVRRIIHTSADFEYIRNVRFSDDAVKKGIQAIQAGCRVFTDTNMAKVGIRKREIQSFGGRIDCLIADKAVAKKAKEDGTTRAFAAVDWVKDDIQNGIYVVGNAPTALLRLIELIEEKQARPALVVGFPVGFVSADESKDALMKVDVPYITGKGRKGGSNVAASVVNALAIMAYEKS